MSLDGKSATTGKEAIALGAFANNLKYDHKRRFVILQSGEGDDGAGKCVQICTDAGKRAERTEDRLKVQEEEDAGERLDKLSKLRRPRRATKDKDEANASTDRANAPRPRKPATRRARPSGKGGDEVLLALDPVVVLSERSLLALSPAIGGIYNHWNPETTRATPAQTNERSWLDA
jgi:hypothetical protein